MAGARAALSMAGARVASTSDASGRYAFEPPEPGEATLALDAARVPSVRLTVSVTETDVELPPVILARAIVLGRGRGGRGRGDAARRHGGERGRAAARSAVGCRPGHHRRRAASGPRLRALPEVGQPHRQPDRAGSVAARRGRQRGQPRPRGGRRRALERRLRGVGLLGARPARRSRARGDAPRRGLRPLRQRGARRGGAALPRPRRPHLAVEASYGSQSTPDVSASGRLRSGAWSLASSAEAFRTDGYLAVDADERGSDRRARRPRATRRSTWPSSARRSRARRAFLRGAYFDESRDNGTPFQRNDTRLRQLSRRASTPTPPATAVRSAPTRCGGTFDQTFSAVAAGRGGEQPRGASTCRRRRLASRAGGPAARADGRLWTRGRRSWSVVKGETERDAAGPGGRSPGGAGGRQWSGRRSSRDRRFGIGSRAAPGRRRAARRLAQPRRLRASRRGPPAGSPIATRPPSARGCRCSCGPRSASRSRPPPTGPSGAHAQRALPLVPRGQRIHLGQRGPRRPSG